MTDREKVKAELDAIIDECRGCDYVRFSVVAEHCTNILALLKEQEDEKKRIMKVIWDTLHEGLSIDTVADQDWVYERIRHRIEDT